MTTLELLRRAATLLRQYAHERWGADPDEADALDALADEMESLQRDAERYRFLVSSPEYAMSKAVQDLWQKTNGIYPTAEQWGAAIDAAMQEPKP